MTLKELSEELNAMPEHERDKYIGRANGYISNAIANKRQIKDIQGRIVKIVPF